MQRSSGSHRWKPMQFCSFCTIFIKHHQFFLAGTTSGLKQLPFQAHTCHSMLQNHFEALPTPAFGCPHFFLTIAWFSSYKQANIISTTKTKDSFSLGYSSGCCSRSFLMNPSWKVGKGGNPTGTSINCLSYMKKSEIQNKLTENSRISAREHKGFVDPSFNLSP